MKNINKYILLLTAIFTMAGCDESEFLDQSNPNNITTETFWKSENDFQAALSTVYGALQFESVSGASLTYEMVQGDLGGTEFWYPQDAFATLSFTNSTEYVYTKWNDLYVGILRANQVIENLSAEDADFDADIKTAIEAEAKFLRAFFYFQLVHSYGGAVIKTTVPKSGDDFNGAFSSIADVNTEVIIPDLEFAYANLPTSWDDSEKGRATWGAAAAMLGKVYLYAEDYNTAASYFEEVINSNLYALTTDIMDNFTHFNEFNAESIFETNYTDSFKEGVNGQEKDAYQWTWGSETGSEASAIGWQTGQLSFGGYNTVLSSYYLHEMFTYDEKDPANPLNPATGVESMRMAATLAAANGEGDYYNLPIGTEAGWGFGQSAYVKKHSNWYHEDRESGFERSGINFRHIRLADIYLMYAEAILQDQGDAAATEAMEYIDRIRTRAGVVTLESYVADNAGQFPAMHTSVVVNGAHSYVNPTAANLLTHIMMVERPLELAFEGHRWKDLVRWGIVGDVLAAHRADEEWLLANIDDETDPLWNTAPFYFNDAARPVRPDYAVSAGNYNSATHDYYPIPTDEVQINVNLTAN
ncbi:RagB/SusD family nutrient uptake outer membrane protein [Reichenbachiella sp.]|uniref:RagB/SusD family nutrient uptake outer membrane protein n=1 Tax=Reichenbachiella sp. TaxID=2184521 RepID=UPI003BB1F1FA